MTERLGFSLDAPVPPTILSQHAEEAAFLWLLRDAAVRAPHYTLSELARLDDRIEAHLSGLLCGGEEGWRVAREELEKGEPGEFFAAMSLALRLRAGDRAREVAELAAVEHARPLLSALLWSGPELAGPQIEVLCAQGDARLVAVAIRAAGIQRSKGLARFAPALRDGEPILQVAAARAAGESGDPQLLAELEDRFEELEGDARTWAACSLAVTARGQPLEVLRAVAGLESQPARAAFELAARLVSPAEASDWHAELVRAGAWREAIELSARRGEAERAPWLIEQMDSPAHSRAAGEALSWITGIDLALEACEREPPDGADAGPTEDPDDTNVALDPDLNLPWPDRDRVSAVWSERGREFARGRHLGGHPIRSEALVALLCEGKQRMRRAAALELALLTPGEAVFPCSAPGYEQRRWLGLRPSRR